ncbi:MAG: hypothetical protein LBM08_10125 [Dysgonamonadaceae bacterium]|jgi:hypothetical protein|nr:hypothetical protein [Dysgonamonadaceae bacterium]
MRKIKFFVLLIVLSCSVNAVWSQDIITLKSGDEIKAKVQEVGLSDVKYKKYGNLDGPVYTLLKTEIFMIKYENGEKDIFKDEPAVSPPVSPEDPRKTLEFESESMDEGFKNAYGVKLSEKEIRAILANVPEALKEYDAGKTLHQVGEVFGWTGSICLGLSLGLLLNPNVESPAPAICFLGGSAASLTAAFILYSKGNAKWKSAYTLYQSNKNGKSTSMNFGLTQSGGAGFILTF